MCVRLAETVRSCAGVDVVAESLDVVYSQHAALVRDLCMACSINQRVKEWERRGGRRGVDMPGEREEKKEDGRGGWEGEEEGGR